MIKWGFTTILFLSFSVYADLKEVATDYAEALIAAHPSLSSVQDANNDAEKFIHRLKYAYDSILFIDGEKKEQLSRHKQVITDPEFKITVSAFRSVVANDPEGKFILKQITTKQISPSQRLFFHRYMRHLSSDFQLKAPEGGSSKLEQLYIIYRAKKKSLGQTPNFEQLELPRDLAYYKEPHSGERLPWIYIANAQKSAYKAPIPIFAIPTPRFTASGKIEYAKANVIHEDGSTSSKLGYKKIKGFNTNTQPAAQIIEGKIEPYHLEILTTSAKVIIARHKLRESAIAKGVLKKPIHANDINLLKLEKSKQSYPSADGNSRHDWIYLGSSHQTTLNNKRIICLSSTPVKTPYHLGFFEDETYTEISSEQFQIIKQKGIK